MDRTRPSAGAITRFSVNGVVRRGLRKKYTHHNDSNVPGSAKGDQKMVEQELWKAYARVLLGSNELLHID